MLCNGISTRNGAYRENSTWFPLGKLYADYINLTDQQFFYDEVSFILIFIGRRPHTKSFQIRDP